MSLYTTLKEIKDFRVGAKDCAFNGYVEDYLNRDNVQFSDTLEGILEIDSEVRVIEAFSVFINKEVIANKIISYKDIHKIPKWYIKAPLILYTEIEGREFAMILVDRNYYEAKGIFFSLTERDALLEPFVDNVMVVDTSDSERIVALYTLLFEGKARCSVLQREQDRRYFMTPQELLAQSHAKSQSIKETLELSFENDPKGRAQRIHDAIASWYLIKKMVYVQYMIDRETLINENENDIKKHRQSAKQMSSSIEFKPFSEMWRQ